jgi:phosphoserine phosphatase RsbU/P
VHTTLKQMPGPRAEMTAVATRWDPATDRLAVANCGQVPAIVVRADGSAETLPDRGGRGLGGRSRPKPAETTVQLSSADRLILVSDGVIQQERGKAGLEVQGVIEAALKSATGTAADTVRKIHAAVLELAEGELTDDATVVCLAVG